MIAFKKNQVALEFIIVLGVILLIFTTLFAVVGRNISFKLKEKDAVAIKETAFIIIDEINLALTSEDGYYREFELPEEINNKDYKINITDGMVYVRTSDEKTAVALPAPPCNGQPAKGLNTIRKQNQEVYLNE